MSNILADKLLPTIRYFLTKWCHCCQIAKIWLQRWKKEGRI